LKRENMHVRIQLKKTINMGEEIVTKENHRVKRSLPLRRQMKSVYRHNRAYQAKNRKLKEEVQQLKE